MREHPRERVAAVPLPLQLPTIQNWSCHNCGGCCRQHQIEITADEESRLVGQQWDEAGSPLAGVALFQRKGVLRRRRFLAHRDDGACVFLDERGLCRIHAKFGEAAKPLACRIYPFAFHPAGGKVALGLRFSCPSVVKNLGRDMAAQQRDLRTLEELVVPAGADRIAPPPISAGQSLDWADTLRITRAVDEELSERAPLVVRILRTLHLVQLLGNVRFEKIRGGRLSELLDLLREEARGLYPPDCDWQAFPEPQWRSQFRLLCAQYARKDTAVEVRSGLAGRWRLFTAAIRFARGKGLAPPLQPGFLPLPFDRLEISGGPWPEEFTEILTRYLRVKVQGLHFCGAAYYGLPVTEGWFHQALVIPVVLWLARWLAASEQRTVWNASDLQRALAIADHHHGYSPVLGQRTARVRARMLQTSGDIARLVAWYAR